MKLIYSITALLLFALTACSKHHGDLTLPDATINFSEPLPGSSYNGGDSISIKGVAISAVIMHGYDIAIKKANDTTTYFFMHIHDHNDTLVINQKWKNTLTGASSLEAQVTVYLDHDGHTVTKKVGFAVH
jgi:hypothetical protein